jgi:hypothetical protein
MQAEQHQIVMGLYDKVLCQKVRGFVITRNVLKTYRDVLPATQ